MTVVLKLLLVTLIKLCIAVFVLKRRLWQVAALLSSVAAMAPSRSRDASQERGMHTMQDTGEGELQLGLIHGDLPPL